MLHNLIFFVLMMFLTGICDAQMSRSFSRLPDVPFDESSMIVDLNNQEKILKLNKLLEIDSVLFKDPYSNSEFPEGQEYFPLDSSGLRFMDLNQDGYNDLLYTGISGSMGMMDTKMFINNGMKLEFKKQLEGQLINVKKNDRTIEFSTYWKPCCDSYTSRIFTYTINGKGSIQLNSTISIIGIPYAKNLPDSVQTDEDEWVMPLPIAVNRMKDFGDLEKVILKQVELYAFKEDFRNTSPYFRERNKEIHEQIRKDQEILMLKVETPINVRIIEKMKRNNQEWLLVITDEIDNVPKSLYEWSQGDNRRFVGWIRIDL